MIRDASQLYRRPQLCQFYGVIFVRNFRQIYAFEATFYCCLYVNIMDLIFWSFAK